MKTFFHDLINNNIYFLVLAVLIIDRLKRNARRTMISAWLVNLHGTVLHELAHLFASILFNGKPTKISLFPTKADKGYILGYVQSSNFRWYNKFPISMAPLLLLFAVYYVDLYYYNVLEDNLYTNLLYVFIIIGLLDSSIPSSQDFKVAFSDIGVFIWLSFIGAFFYYLFIINL